MGENTRIEWASHTFNAWLGCAKVSEACKHCYAESWAKRTGNPDLWKGTRRRTSVANWRKPVKWNAQAEAEGIRYRVFCSSLADVFEDFPRTVTKRNFTHLSLNKDGQLGLGGTYDPKDVIDLAAWRKDLFALIRATPYLDWLLLTKRPENMVGMLPDDWGDGYANVWLGTTVESQKRADERIPHLVRVPAKVRFVSAEPLLELIDLQAIDFGDSGKLDVLNMGLLHWVITGGESGGGARPLHPEWVRSLRDQCMLTFTAFLFKQWGEFAPLPPEQNATRDTWVAYLDHQEQEWDFGMLDVNRPYEIMPRIGKKAAGRHLDGVLHTEFPQ